MQDKPNARCTLQIARELRRRKYPDDFGPEQDICDVTLWLREKFPFSQACVLLSRHYTQRGKEMASIAVRSERFNSKALSLRAREAFLALGYTMQDMGKETYRCPACYGHHSKHEILTAYGRIECVLRLWRPS